jgi:hypothetical protein
MKSEELTVEQQFKLKVLGNHIQSLSQMQAQKLLLKAIKQNMIQDNVIRSCKLEERTPIDING